MPKRRPDPQLVRYLRTHLPRFDAEALRAKLLEEGVEAEEIDAALAAAQRRSPAQRLRTPLLILAGIAIILLGLSLLPKRAPAPGNGRSANAPSGAPQSSGTYAAAGDSNRPFIGRSGYVLQLPPGYETSSGFKDQKKATEVVFIFPAGTDPTNFGNEGIFNQLGILRLEASPRQIPEGRIGMESLRSGVTRTLKARKASYTTRETQIGGLQALVVNIAQPFPLTQAFVLGDKELYVLTGGTEDALFTNVLQSLREGGP